MIDPVDRQLINILNDNAEYSSEILAKKLNVSSSTIRRRISKLTQQGILRIIAIPDPERIGFHTVIVLGLNVDREKLDSILLQLSNRLDVIKWLSATTGRFDIMAIAWFRSSDDLYYFLEVELNKIHGIKNIEMFISLRRWITYGSLSRHWKRPDKI